MIQPEPPTEAGWYDDPHSGKHQIYWNGTKWTGETRSHPVRARRQARVAGWVLLAIILTTIIGIGVNTGAPGCQGCWLVQLAFFMFGGMAAVPALAIYAWLARRANRIEREESVWGA